MAFLIIYILNLEQCSVELYPTQGERLCSETRELSAQENVLLLNLNLLFANYDSYPFED
jgi:hypothetical protein